MMNSNNYAGNHGKMTIIIFVLIDLKKEIKEDIVIVRRANTYIECTPQTKAF